MKLQSSTEGYWCWGVCAVGLHSADSFKAVFQWLCLYGFSSQSWDWMCVYFLQAQKNPDAHHEYKFHFDSLFTSSLKKVSVSVVFKQKVLCKLYPNAFWMLANYLQSFRCCCTEVWLALCFWTTDLFLTLIYPQGFLLSIDAFFSTAALMLTYTK